MNFLKVELPELKLKNLSKENELINCTIWYFFIIIILFKWFNISYKIIDY